MSIENEMGDCEEKISQLLVGSGKLEDAALMTLEYLEKYQVGLNWHEVVGRIHAALKEWHAVVEEVGVSDD